MGSPCALGDGSEAWRLNSYHFGPENRMMSSSKLVSRLITSLFTLLKTDFLEEEFGAEIKMESDLGKAPQLPVFPKEEQMSEDELDKMMEERYKPGAGFVTFAEDRYDKRTIERNTIIPSAEDPTIWKVKCTVILSSNSIGYFFVFTFSQTEALWCSLNPVFVIMSNFLAAGWT